VFWKLSQHVWVLKPNSRLFLFIFIYFVSRSKQSGYFGSDLYFEGLETQSLYFLLCWTKNSFIFWDKASSPASLNCSDVLWVYVKGSYPVKKNFVLAFSGAWTRPKVHGSRSFGFIIGATENSSPPLPDPLNDGLTNALAWVVNSSFVLLRGTYDFL